MNKLIKFGIFALVLSTLYEGKAQTCSGGNCSAASCNTSDVQTCINSTTEGNTCTIPAGSCTWTSGVTISGKGIVVTGAGSGRIIAINQAVLNIATGTLSITIQSARVDGTYPLGPNVGQSLTVFQFATRTNWMQGTVTSFNSSTGALVMNITSTSGTTASPQQHHWGIATIPQTSIANDSTGNPLFAITEDTAFNTQISDIKFLQGTTTYASAYDVGITYQTGGLPVVVHDCWMEAGAGSAQIQATTNHGLVYNCSFDSTPFSMGGTVNSALNVVPSNTVAASSWTSTSTWGSADTGETHNFYFETNDVHAYLVAAGGDNGGRIVYRYNFLDNAGFANHGADTSNYGIRYFEYYNNEGIFTDYSDGYSTLNMADGWIFNRGGTFVAFNNTLPWIGGGSDLGSHADVGLTVMNLQRNEGPNPCWGAGYSTAGQYYHAPRQNGYGYVTGTGTANYPPDGVNNSPTDSVTYVGDSEPIYMWNNTTHTAPNMDVSIEDYGLGSGNSCPSGPTPDSSANYLVSGRDYFNSNTAKPGYTAAPYPHPLAISTSTRNAKPTPAAPTNLTAVPQ